MCVVSKVYSEEEIKRMKWAKNQITIFDPAFQSNASLIFDFDFLKTLAYVESRFKADAYNPMSGARGLMQITKIACQDVNRSYERLFEFDYNIKTANLYLDKLFYGYELASKTDVLVAYNWGIGNLRNCKVKYGDDCVKHLPIETRNYIYLFRHLYIGLL